MPLDGLLNVEEALKSAPTLKSLVPETLVLPGADVLQVSYEVEESKALDITPPSCHPSIPPYATFSFMKCPESPAGPFTMAMVRLIIRAGIRPRGLLVGAFIDNPDAAEALGSGWGFTFKNAHVNLSRRHNRMIGTVEIDGVTALEATLTDPDPVAPTDIELFDNLHLVNLVDEDPVIVQVDPGYVYESADRGIPALSEYNAELLGTTAVEPIYRQVAVSCKAEVTFAAPRFVMDPVIIAYEGTRRLQPS